VTLSQTFLDPSVIVDVSRPQNAGTHQGGGIVMNKNVGSMDRLARVILGIVVLSLVFVGPKSVWAYLGIVPLATGLIGWCPAYELLGISTSRTEGRARRTQV
jgi:hypothetical protein